MGDFEATVGLLGVLSFVFSLMAEELAARVEYVVAVVSDAVDVIADLGESAVVEVARVGFEELFESVF